MDVRIEARLNQLCVCLRHTGPYQDVAPSFGRLGQWVATTGCSAPPHLMFGLSYDDPDTVPAAELRYDICAPVIDQTAPLPPDIRYEMVGGGRWGIHTLVGPYSGMSAVFRYLRGGWLKEHHETLDDRPFMEIYLNMPGTVPESGLMTDICVPLKPAAP